MINVSRRLLRQLRTVFRHALRTSPRGPIPAVVFRATSQQLTIRAQTKDAAIEYHLPGEYLEYEVCVPGDLFVDCEHRSHELVTIEDQESRSLIVGECLAQSLADPGGSWVGSDADVEDPPASMVDDEEDIENLKGDCRHSEKVHCGEVVTVITEERHPTLAGLWFCGTLEHVPADGALGHIKAEHLQLAVNTRCSPAWIFPGQAWN